VTTSSRKKGILPVRLGLEPDNKTALKELKMDPDLADKMTDEELDKLIIDKEYNEGLEYYKACNVQETIRTKH
jgi:hypothetical protein